MKSKYLFRAIALLFLFFAVIPADSANALFVEVIPPADMFQLPWEQGKSWVALDGFDNGTKRKLNSPHYYLNGGAIDFAPHNNMQLGEDTSNYWVTAAAAGKVIEKSSCAVKIDHGNGWTSEYQFLANIQVKVGDVVYRNQRLAVIADGLGQMFCLPIVPDLALGPPHLHFSVRPNMRNATFAGWLVKYVPYLNQTTFTKNGQTLGLYQPILNQPNLQIVLRDPLTWDTLYTGNVDAYRYERWPFALTETANFTLTATPTTSGLVPLLILLDANGNEITRSTGTLTSTQSVGNYFVQVQPQAGNGSYTLLLHKNNQPEPTGPYVSTSVVPTSISIGQTATVTVKLGNVPAEGYTSAEFTCTYNANLVEISNIAVTNLFGADPVSAINGPQNGSFIVAIAGSKDQRATTSGTAFTFNVKGLQAGQLTIECKARISKGDNTLTSIQSIPATLTVLGSAPASTPTSTPVAPPAQTTPTLTPTPSSTAQASLCDKAEFVADINVPPGTIFSPGAAFTKTWRVRNAGTCTWTTSYQIVFSSGDTMSGPTSIAFPTNIAPNATADISISLTAPSAAGRYVGYWIFRNANGNLFGSGAAANEPLSVDITVSGPSVTPGGPTATSSLTPTPSTSTPQAGTAYDFAANVCQAVWSSGAGQLPCPGVDGDIRGFVLPVNNPSLETGTIDSRPGLITFPQSVYNGYIQGVYPAFHVQNGDRFRALINCEHNAASCFVTFRLSYQIGSGPITTFWSLNEKYDGLTYSVDLDLSSLAGQDVKFILSVLAAGSPTGDRALWVAPSIYRTATPTPVVSATPTITATPTIVESNWVAFDNSKYGFRFLYPNQSQLVAGSTDNYAFIYLPITPGTNLGVKYLELFVSENANPCRSPLATSSMLETSETVVFNSISFLKETGGDPTAGHMNKWVAYSTARGNACVSLDFVMRIANPGDFATPPVLVDEAAESLVFGQIVSTYTWLDLSPTITPTSTPGASPSPTGTATTPANGAVLTGQVNASKVVTVRLYDQEQVLVSSVDADPEGTFRLDVPAGTYTIVASANGFLRIQGTVTLANGNTRAMPAISLLAGDIDGNNVIDQFDALTIGMSYNTADPPAADLNNDGIINVLDLELLANNYRKTGPIAWQ